MDKLSAQKEVVKLEKKLSEEEVAELRALPLSELEFKFNELAKHREEITSTKNKDEELSSAKEVVKELNAPYAEQIKGNKLKSRFIFLLIKEKKEE